MSPPDVPMPGDEEAAGPLEGARLADRIANELELLERNVELLERLANNPPMGIIRLSEAMHLPIHKVRYSLHLLEREGVIQPSADGAVVTDLVEEYWANLNRSLERMSLRLEALRSRAGAHRGRGSVRRKGY
ncbi:MAG: hypothetical protein QXG65_06310 [Thermoplasmata archaeon]